MNDGNKTSGGVILNTQGFSVEGVSLLIVALNINFGFHCYMRFERNLPVVNIPAADKNLLLSLVVAHMCPSTLYKLGLK